MADDGMDEVKALKKQIASLEKENGKLNDYVDTLEKDLERTRKERDEIEAETKRRLRASLEAAEGPSVRPGVDNLTQAYLEGIAKVVDKGEASNNPMVRQIVDRLHVGASDKEVEAYVRSRMTPTFRKTSKGDQIVRDALAHHRYNQGVYAKVTSGRL